MLGFALLAAGCISTTESHGVTAREYSGSVPVTFINATPERLCGLYISFDNEPEYGDNWLPAGGLPVGKSLDLTIKDGTYKAKWNTCKDVRDVGSVNYSATWSPARPSRSPSRSSSTRSSPTGRHRPDGPCRACTSSS
jgi:hypothetical protein